MKAHILILFSLLLGNASLMGQWNSETYQLKGGWNSIYLHGDASHSSIDDLFPDSGATSGVLEIWRWNPNPDQMQFTQSPLLPSNGTIEWSKWIRGAPEASTLTRLTGQNAYLVRCAGSSSTTYDVPIVQSPRLPQVDWVRNGGNFMGFPSLKNGDDFPTFSSYFATFPAAIAANTKIFKYVGGDLGPGNPVQVFSTAQEKLNRHQAYWFSSEVVGNFFSPLHLTFSHAEGLNFGRTGSVVTARAVNRSASVVTITVSPSSSLAAPAGQEVITGPVPLTIRTFDSETADWREDPLPQGGTSLVIEPNGTLEIQFGIKRTDMTGSPGAFFASMVRFTTSDNLIDILVPATARKTSLAGLWVGDVLVNAVESKAQSDVVKPTSRSFPLRYLIHVSDDGTARVLSQVFSGPLASSPHNPGLCTHESGLKADSKALAERWVSTHLPLDRVLDGTNGSGSFSIPGSLTREIITPYNDPTNPFVAQYNPAHDNKGPDGQALGNKVESYSVTRKVTFNFTNEPPEGFEVTSGWGSHVIGGTYSEVIDGLHKDSTGTGTGNGIHLNGIFLLQRKSEIGTIQINSN